MALPAQADAPRRVIDFDANWQFRLGDAAWRRVDLPHDWSIEGEYKKSHPGGPKCGYLPSGVGHYRKTFTAPAGRKARHVRVEFDGVYMDSAVSLNGHRLGRRPYGYVSFGYDITPHIKAGENVIEVRVDNSKEPSARWHHGCGVYGHVRLVVTHKSRFAVNGIAVTAAVSGDAAAVRIAAEVAGPRDGLTVRRSVVTPAGRHIAGTGESVRVPRPLLWSPDSPTLYTAVAELLDGGEVIDRVETRFGIRTVKFDAERGFLLNGEPVKLKGVCEHQSAGPVGAAWPDALLEWKLQILKEMGCNSIRTAHNPQTPAFYDLCDRMGIMVMDEIFDGWHRKAGQDYGARFFEKWWRRDVTDWVKRDRNHPCVVIWSVGNEAGRRDKYDITSLIHKLDPQGRPTTGGMVTDGVDVAGFNGPGGKPGVLERYHRRNPTKPIVLTEVPHTLQTRGFYRVKTWWRDKNQPRFNFPPYATEEVFAGGHPRYSSSYDNAGVRISARTSWRRTKNTPWVSGEFRWTGFDYLGEAGYKGGEWPARMWNFGIIDLAGLPKDHYHFYRAEWSGKDVIHLLPPWSFRDVPAGTVIPVVAYSNCDEVELFLNHKSLGRRKKSRLLDFAWRVPYNGPAVMEAVGYRGGEEACRVGRVYGSRPRRLVLTSHIKQLKPDGRDAAALTCSAADDAGRHVPWADTPIRFHVEGLEPLSFENGDPVDVTPPREPRRRLFNGYCRAFVRSRRSAGPAAVVAVAVFGDRRFRGPAEVAVDVREVRLGGPAAGGLTLHVTADGTEPTAATPVYRGPLTLTGPATVKVLVARGGEPLMRFGESFASR